MKLKKVHVAAKVAHEKAKPVYEGSERACAVSAAVFEFVHVHEIVMIASGALLLSLAVFAFGRGAELLLGAAESLFMVVEQ